MHIYAIRTSSFPISSPAPEAKSISPATNIQTRPRRSSRDVTRSSGGCLGTGMSKDVHNCNHQTMSFHPSSSGMRQRLKLPFLLQDANKRDVLGVNYFCMPCTTTPFIRREPRDTIRNTQDTTTHMLQIVQSVSLRAYLLQ